MVKPGDRYTCRDGVTVIAVDKRQARQTKGYWINSNVVSLPLYFDHMASTDFLWDILKDSSEESVDAAFKNNKENLLMCLESEMDTYENEFGVVSP